VIMESLGSLMWVLNAVELPTRTLNAFMELSDLQHEGHTYALGLCSAVTKLKIGY
jgi:hypothetical protein